MTVSHGTRIAEFTTDRGALSTAEEAVYRALIERANGTISDLVKSCPHTAIEVGNALRALERAGLVSRTA